MSRPSITETAPPHIVTEMQMMKERIDFMMNTLKGRVQPQRFGPPNQFTIHHIRQLLPPTTEVPHAADRKLRQSQGSFRSLEILQNSDAPSRSGRRDHV